MTAIPQQPVQHLSTLCHHDTHLTHELHRLFIGERFRRSGIEEMNSDANRSRPACRRAMMQIMNASIRLLWFWSRARTALV